MPNWCDNDLYIEGPEADIRAFLGFAKGRMNEEELLLDFNKIVPMPKTVTTDMITEPWLKAMRLTAGQDGDLWYEWRLQYWGTKWQPQGVHIEEEKSDDQDSTRRVKMVFDTAWSPPKPIIVAASQLFPTLDFELRYFEAGCGFNGLFICRYGEVQSDQIGSYFGERGG